jgi:hypothetical protein
MLQLNHGKGAIYTGASVRQEHLQSTRRRSVTEAARQIRDLLL